MKGERRKNSVKRVYIVFTISMLILQLLYIGNVHANPEMKYRALLWSGGGVYIENREEVCKALRRWSNWKDAEIRAGGSDKEKLFYNIDEWLAKDCDEDDMTLLYLNAHGMEPPRKDLDPKDEPGDPKDDEYLETTKVNEWLRDDTLGPELKKIKGNIIVIVEACYAGGFAGDNSGWANITTEVTQDIGVTEGLSNRCEVLQSSYSIETSYKLETLTPPNYFTNKLLEGINQGEKKGADEKPIGNEDGNISVEEAIQYVGPEITTKDGKKQHPTWWDGDKTKEKVFLLPPFENVTYPTPPKNLLEPPSVGGIVVPVDKFGLLAPYIGLASTILVATVATAIYVKRVKPRKEKQ